MSKRPWILVALESPEKHPFAFIFVISLALSVAGNGISTLLLDSLCTWLERNSQLTKESWQFAIVVILISIIAFGSTNLNTIWQRFLGRSIYSQTKVRPLTDTYQGLIVLMSLGDNPPAATAIRHHWNNSKGNLKHCWIVGVGEDSLKATELLIDKLSKTDNIPQSIFKYNDKYPNTDDGNEFSLVVDPEFKDDPNHICQLIECIYNAASNLSPSLAEDEIIIDFTGGQKPATAGAILAGAKPGRRMQFTSSDYVNNVRTDSKIVEIDISYQVKPVKNKN